MFVTSFYRNPSIGTLISALCIMLSPLEAQTDFPEGERFEREFYDPEDAEMWYTPSWRYGGWDLEEAAMNRAVHLTLLEDGELEANPEKVAAIFDDLMLIYGKDPAISQTSVWTYWVPGHFSLTNPSFQVDRALQAGTYQPWLDLQAQYGEGSTYRIGEAPYVHWSFRLPTPLHGERLAEWVRENWEGVDYVMASGGDEGGYQITRYPGPRWYVFDNRDDVCCGIPYFRVFSIENGQAIELTAEDLEARIELVHIVGEGPQIAAVGEENIGIGAAVFRLDGREDSEIRVVRANFAYQDESGAWVRSAYIQEAHFENELWMEIGIPLTLRGIRFPVELERVERPSRFLGTHRHADGWLRHFHIGWVNDTFYPWLWHEDHGWWWFDEEKAISHGWWVWDLSLGWTFALSEKYGWLYDFSGYGWLAYHPGTSNPRVFWILDTEEWISID